MSFDSEKGMQWMFAVGVSLALHVVVLALFVMSSADGVAERTVSKDLEKAVETDTHVPSAEPSVEPSVEAPVAPTEASAAPPAVKTPSVEAREPKVKEAPKEASNPSGLETYVVAKGDMLIRIAQDHGCTLQELAKLNGTTVKKLSNLRVGQKIKVPKK